MTNDAHDGDERRRTLADDSSLLLHAEELRVRTERVPTGRVTLRKRVVTKQETITVTVRHEEVEVVEESADDSATGLRTQVTGEHLRDTGQAEGVAPRSGTSGTSADLSGRADSGSGEAELVLYAERPVVTLEVVPVERIRLTREVVTHVQEVSGEVAREVADVETERL